MDLTQRLDWEDEEKTAAERHKPVGNLHMFAGIHGPAQDFPIYTGPNIIGRHSSCNITLPAQSVSKKHAVLCVTEDRHTICDNGSLNKTRRSKVALEPDVPYSLSDGDFLLFADVACRYTTLKKIEVQTLVAEESEDDSMLVPGTQAALAVEKTPCAAIRRMGRGAVLAKDSGDEDDEVHRGWSDGGEGGSKDAPKKSGPGALFSPDARTFVPESDEENDTSSSGIRFTSIHLYCDSDTDNRETPTKESSFIPSSLNRFTPAAVSEPAKEESSRLLHTNKDEKPVGEQTDEEKEISLVGRDVVSDSGLLEDRKETSKDGADDRLPCVRGRVVQTDTLDSELKDGGTKAINRSSSHEDKNHLKNDAENIEASEVSSTSSHCLKDNEDENSRRDIAATTAIESNPDSHTQEEDNLKPAEEKLKVAADLCLDSDTDSDEDVPTTSGTEIKKKDDVDLKFDKAPEQSSVDGTSDPGVHMDRDAVFAEDKEKISALHHGGVGEINIDSDTDVEDDTEVSETGHAESRTGNGNSSEVHKVHSISGTNVSTGFDIDSDTDVEDADIIKSDGKVVDQESRETVDEKKEQFHLDSDTDVEDNDDVSSTKVRKGDLDSVSADVSLKETKDGIHMDSDTDVEEDVNVSSTDLPKGKQTLNIDVQEGFHVDSDTDVEDVDVSSTVVTKEKQDSSNSVKDVREGLPLDSDTDVDEQDQGPGPSSAAVQSRTTESHADELHFEMGKNEKEEVGVTNQEAAELQFDSDTDVDEDDGTSTGPKQAGGFVKNEAEAANEAAALHMDSDTDVDEDDASMRLDKSQIAEGESHGDGVSEEGDGNLDKVAGTSVGVRSEVPKADTSTVSVKSSEEISKADSQGADYELMDTQCYLEPREPEEDLPDEEEATQAYFLSSTWAEPDTFKRPSDPVGVLQISAATLDKSEEEVDENAIAETQLFCLGADQSPGSDFKDTPQLEQVMDDQQDTQPSSSVEVLRQEAQGAILQDTEPISQCLSAKPPVETGTSLHLKRDVPAAIWMKGLQQKGERSLFSQQGGEPSDVEDSTQEDSTQDELDLAPLELEATESFILEVPDIQEHRIQDHDPSLAVQVDHSKLDESAVPAAENPPKDPDNLGPGVEVPATETPPTGLSILERDASPVPSTESTPTRPSIHEAVPANESPLTESSILESSVSAASLTEGPPTELSRPKLDASAVPATETPPKLSNLETQINDDDATQAYILNLPVSDINIPQSKLEVPSNEDATQPCGSDVEYIASKEAESSGVTMMAVGKEEPELTDTGKGKPSSKRGLSRSRKNEQPEKSTEISTEKAAPAAHSAPEETAELHAGELGQSGPRIAVSEMREEIKPEKNGRRGRRKATDESETKAKTKNEFVVPTASQNRSSKIASDAEPSTSGNNEIRRRQPSRKSIVKMQEEEKQDESKKNFGSAPQKCKKSDVFEILSDNHLEKIGLRSEFENVTGPTFMELSVGQTESHQERDVASLLEPNGDENVSTSSKNTGSNESRILNLPEQSGTISAPQNKKPVRGKRQAATKAKPHNTQETISNDDADKTEAETSGTNFEAQDDVKIPTPRPNDLKGGGNEGPRGRRTRTSRISTSEPLEHEKPKGADTKACQNEEANTTCPGDQNSANRRSTRQQRNVKEEAKEDSQKEQTGRSKRAINLRGDQRNKERNDEHTLEDSSGSSSIPKRTLKHSKEEMPKPEQDIPEVGKIEEDNLGKLPRARKGYKEEQKLEDNKGSLESSNTAESQTTKRTQRGSKGKDIVDKEETVKETVTRKIRNSKLEDAQLGEDQGKRSVRTRRLSKEEVVEETTTNTTKENTAGQNIPRRTRRNVKADEKTESENAGDLKPNKELSQSERSSSKRRKTSSEDSGKLTENTEVEEELSEGTKRTDEESSRKGRTRGTSAKEELPQVSTPVANRKRGQALKADVDLKRKKLDETSEAKVEIPAARRGRPRKLSTMSTTDDSQTSAGGSRVISTPEPSPSRSSRLRQSPALSNLAEGLTPRRTGRLCASTLTASPYSPQPGALPKVLFTGVVDAMGEEIIRSLGGDVADSVFDCTHLITDRVRRTVKFLCALARGIPIVTLDWIDKCKKSGCFLSPTKFLVKDKEQEKNFNFALSESLQKAKRSPLFEGYDFHITPSVKPEPDLMKDIIRCSGATFLPKMPRTFKEKCVIVSCPEDAARCKSVPSRIPVTTAEFILTGILRQEVNPSAYLVSSEMEDSAPAPAKRRR